MNIKTFTVPADLTLTQMKNYIMEQMAIEMGMFLVGANDTTAGMFAMENNSEAGFMLWPASTTETAINCSVISVYKGMEFGKVRVNPINDSQVILRTAPIRGQMPFNVGSGYTYYLYHDITSDGLAFYITTTKTANTAARYLNFVARASDNRYGYFTISYYSFLNETSTSILSNTGQYMLTISGDSTVYTTSTAAESGLLYSYQSVESVDDTVVLQNVFLPLSMIYFPNLYIPVKRLPELRVNIVELNTGGKYLIVGMNVIFNVSSYQITPVYYMKM